MPVAMNDVVPASNRANRLPQRLPTTNRSSFDVDHKVRLGVAREAYWARFVEWNRPDPEPARTHS